MSFAKTREIPKVISYIAFVFGAALMSCEEAELRNQSQSTSESEVTAKVTPKKAVTIKIGSTEIEFDEGSVEADVNVRLKRVEQPKVDDVTDAELASDLGEIIMIEILDVDSDELLGSSVLKSPYSITQGLKYEADVSNIHAAFVSNPSEEENSVVLIPPSLISTVDDGQPSLRLMAAAEKLSFQATASHAVFWFAEIDPEQTKIVIASSAPSSKKSIRDASEDVVVGDGISGIDTSNFTWKIPAENETFTGIPQFGKNSNLTASVFNNENIMVVSTSHTAHLNIHHRFNGSWTNPVGNTADIMEPENYQLCSFEPFESILAWYRSDSLYVGESRSGVWSLPGIGDSIGEMAAGDPLKLVCNSKGDAVMAWLTENNSKLHLSTKLDGVWSHDIDNVFWSQSSSSIYDFDIAISENGRIDMTIVQKTSSPNYLLFKLDLSDGVWSGRDSATSIVSGSQRITSKIFSNQNGTVDLVWIVGSHLHRGIYDGESWSLDVDPSSIDLGTGLVNSAEFTPFDFRRDKNNYIHLLWTATSAGIPQLYYSYEDGGGWHHPQTTADKRASYFPTDQLSRRIRSNRYGHAILGWSNLDGGTNRLLASFSGASWDFSKANTDKLSTGGVAGFVAPAISSNGRMIAFYGHKISQSAADYIIYLAEFGP